MTKTLERSELHLCNNRRQLLFALADVLGRRVRARVLYLEDNAPLGEVLRHGLDELAPDIEISVTTDAAEIAHFATLPAWMPGLLRRNLRLGGRAGLMRANSWRLPILGDADFGLGYVYHPGFFASKPVAGSCARVVMRESGLNNYVSRPVPLTKAVLRALSGLPARRQTWGEEPWIDVVEVARPDLLPAILRKKARRLTFAQVLNRLPEDALARLRLLFAPGFDKDTVDLGPGASALLLTQPLDHIGLCSQVQKQQIYDALAAALCEQGYRVYLKRHPADAGFNVTGTTPLPADFPIELWSFLDLPRFDRAVAVCSAALLEGEALLADRVDQMLTPAAFTADGVQRWIADLPAALSMLRRKGVNTV